MFWKKRGGGLPRIPITPPMPEVKEPKTEHEILLEKRADYLSKTPLDRMSPENRGIATRAVEGWITEEFIQGSEDTVRLYPVSGFTREQVKELGTFCKALPYVSKVWVKNDIYLKDNVDEDNTKEWWHIRVTYLAPDLPVVINEKEISKDSDEVLE